MRRTLMVLLLASEVLANGGHDQGQANSPLPPAAVAGAKSASAQTELFEVVVRAPGFTHGEPTRVRIFLSDFATNKPVSGAKIDLEVPMRPSPLKASVQGTPNPGVYEVEIPFPSEGRYDFEMTIRAGDESDLLLLRGLEIARSAP